MRGEKGGERGRGEYKNLNRVRNEHRDHTSYYFTNFPESHNEEDFWKTFMRWGKVRDMFIAPRRNRGDKEYNIELLQKILVGRLKKPKEIYNNNEILLMEGVCSLKMRYIGDNLVLLTAMDREDIVDVIKKPEEWLTDLFEIIGPWDAKATPANRLTWLRISGEQGVL
ncbi:hypothetical protein JHK85_024978 [Glycine max]|nr:hypothetical protein JHK85_024978 [Glycine max]